MDLTYKEPGPERGKRKTAESRQSPRWPQGIDGLTAEQVDFAALARVLANICRWGGRTVRFYSIAQHAVLASREIEALADPNNQRRLALFALLAEARVAWLSDVFGNGPVSTRTEERVRREGAVIDRAVREAAGLQKGPTSEEAELLRFVGRMLEAALRRDLPEAGFPKDAGAAFPPIRRRIRPRDPGQAAKAWLKRFDELTGPCADEAGVDDTPTQQPAADPGLGEPVASEGNDDDNQTLAA